ncbi:hypothetical protein [Chryseobacterium defluvii]|uniref:Uncharacterized protein n=1 Tax=Chryseobacterium defluvii TaxID=160396 RepID=A0A495SNB4_9FLAO|nr:hypothetical protein [Chryseobacterium defluvii]RKT01758.1 hypothetical protein BCF58_0982 [Chryseobacterium defluvii]
MKNLRLTLGIAAIAIGSFAAFSFTKVEKSENKALNTYYPVRTGATTFHWQMLNPNDYVCDEGGASCTGYQAASAPADNIIPSGYTKTNQALVPKP